MNLIHTHNIFKAFPLPSLLLSVNDFTFTINAVNTAYENENSIAAKAILGKSIFEHFISNGTEQGQTAQLEESLLNTLRTKETQKFVVIQSVLHKEATKKIEVKYFEIENIPVLNDKNEVESIIHTIKDVSEKFVSMLEKEQDLGIYKTMFQNSLTPFFITKPDGTIISTNYAATQLFGYTEAELQQIGRDGVIDPTTPSFNYFLEHQQKKGNILGEFVGIKKDGKKIPIEVFSQIFLTNEGIEKTFTRIIDISEKKRAEEEVSLLMNNTEESFILVDTNLIISTFNQQFKNLYKQYFNIEIKKGASILEYSQPDRLEKVKKIYENVLEGNKEQSHLGVCDRDGNKLLFSIKYNPAYDGHQQIIGVFVTISNITELIALEKKQKAQEADLKALIENTPDFIYSIDVNFNLITFNSSFSNLMKMLRNVQLERGMNVFDLFGEEKREKYLRFFEIIKKGERLVFEDTFLQNENITYYEVAANPIFNEKNVLIGINIFSKDITEQRKLKLKEEEQRAEFKALVDNMTDIVYSLDMDFNMITFNKAMVDASIGLIGKPPYKGINLLEHYAMGKADLLKNNFQKAFEGESVTFIYDEMIAGVLQYFEVTVNPIFSDENIQTGFSVLSKIITEKVIAEKTTQDTLHHLNNILDLSLDVICTFDDEGKFVSVNAASKKLWGYYPHELIGKSFLDFVYPEDKEKTIEISLKITSNIEVAHFENRYVRKDGRVVDILWSNRWESKSRLVYCTAKDITEKKAIDNLLVESFNRYKYLFENNPAPMFIFDFKTLQIIDCNNETLLKYGYEREEFLQLSVKDIRPKEDIHFITEATKSEEAFKSLNRKIYRHKKKSGELISVETVGHLMTLGEKRVVLVQIQDVTEQVRAFRELRNNEAKLRTATNIAKLGYWQLNLNTKVFDISEDIFNIFTGLQESFVLTYDSFLNAIHPEDKKKYEEAEKLAFNGESEINNEIRIILKNGSLNWVKIIGKFVKDNDGNVFLLEGTIQDITEQKNSQLALEERNIFIETAFDNLPIGIAVNKIDDGKSTLMNKKFGEIYGWPPEMLTDVQNFFEKIFPDKIYRAEISQRILTDIESGDITRMSWDGIVITTQTGEKRIVNGKNIPLYDQNLIISSVVDVTEINAAQQKIIQSNERYRLATKATSDAIWDWDLASGTLFWGEGFKQLFGYNEDELSSDIYSWISHLHPEDSERISNSIREFIDGNDLNWKAEFRYQKADGLYAYVIAKGFIQRDNDGKATRMVGAMQDVTNQKEREQQLKLYESVVLNTNDSVMITEAEPFDEPGPRILFVNEAFTKMTGYSAEDVIGKSPRILQGPQSDMEELNRLGTALRNWQPYEVTTINYKKNGEPFWINFSVTPIADETGWYTHWIAIERDITEKVNHEQQLIEANRKIVNTLESIQDGFYALDKNWVVTYWNKEAEKLLKVKREEIIGKNLWQTFKQIVALRFHNEYIRAVEENTPVRFEEYLSDLGSWFEMSAFPSEDGMTVYFKDITERKRNEQEIKSERNLLRTLIDNLPDTIYYKDTDARKLISNKFDYSLIGAETEEEVLGKTDLELFSSNLTHEGYKHDIEILKTGKPLVNYEEYFTTHNGNPIWLLTSKMPIKDDKGKIVGLLGIGRDITERKVAEEKIKNVNNELEKYVQQLLISNAELEQFAYVASHDLQEPLRMITSFLTQLEKKYNDVLDERGKQYIYFAVDGAKRMRQIILDLLEFSRIGRAEDKMELLDLNELVNEILILHRKQIKEKKAVISINNLPKLITSKNYMRQVFQNLISNCLKYTSTQDGIIPEISISAESFENHWQFSIADNGIGIDPKYFDKIFIIFQRLHNKDEYSGTGIGLAITKKIIENLGGNIWVKSEEGKGSTFYFTIAKQDI
ncbi:Adaptive-response sensory-kinase SasA [Emticicia aquatica]|uniref:histidine kinase n=1 Tax=Emticicia aquatica TaxID=1681835 RepID=A0ABN8EPG5_9BACT|nr:PAS domain S-box protein [Emticicia aquatica]CAH0994809.1 Adaptive-response sensory-kinase SasA [Emticicia aquatica]